MAEAALKTFGRIDYLVNNAALRGEKHIDDMSFEEWRQITGVILDGAFHCVKACLPAISKSDAGSIINIGGLTGSMGAPDRAHVVTAKAGIAGFTRALAMELSAAQDHRQHRGAVDAGAPRQAGRDPGAPGLQAAARPRRLSRTTSRRWCACCSARAAATSPGRSCTSAAARISTCDAIVDRCRSSPRKRGPRVTSLDAAVALDSRLRGNERRERV